MALDKTFNVGEVLNAADVNSHLLGLWIPIDKRVIASGSPVSSVSFQSINSNFRLFRITAYAALTAATMCVRFNNDSGNNYATQIMYGNGASPAGSVRFTAQPQIVMQDADMTAPIPWVCTMTISKTLTSVGAAVIGHVADQVTPTVLVIGGVWNNTSALINRIDLFPSANTFHGVFALEGMRGV